MSRTVALGLALVAGAVALLLWSVQQERGGVARSRGGDAPAQLVEPQVQLVPPPPAAELAITDGTELAEPPSTRTARPAEPLAEQPRISGTVRVPGGIPPGETVQLWGDVVWYSRSAAPRSVKTRVASDGSFTLALPEGAKAARLSLESRFFALPATERVRVGETGVVLEPCVYAAIVGDVVPPRSVSRRSWADMEVSWKAPRSLDLDPEAEHCIRRSPTRDEPARPNRDGAFELPLVPAGIALELHAENPFGPEWSRRVGPLAPREVHRLEIALEPGITISGRVIDEHGQPVPEIEVSTDEDERAGEPRLAARTDREGRFELARIPRQVLRITAAGRDLARGAEATVDGAAGDVRDLVLAVVRGGCLEGTVLWPDGSPVDGFEIRARGPSHAGKYLEGSRFRLCGLLEGSYHVLVRALRGEVAGSADCSDLRTNQAPVELVLREAAVFDLRGTVVDERKAPIAKFTVRARQHSPELRSRSAEESSDGTFSFVALEAGEWTLAAEAPGFQSARQRVAVGGGPPAPVRIVLSRAGRIRGRVLDPTGAPVAGARVGEEEDALLIVLAARLPRDGSTDDEGRFELRPTSPIARILAYKEGFAASEILELALAPGDTVDGIELRLREPCRLEGRVLDERGDPLPGATIGIDWLASPSKPVESDGGGAFELAGLPPGPCTLFAFHPRDESTASATVALAPGQTAQVEVRFERPDPVLVRGRITRRGKPVQGCLGLRSRAFRAECASDAGGCFEVTLQQPGAWRGAVWLGNEPFPQGRLTEVDVRRFEVTVPDAEEHAFELDFDALPRLTSMEELLR